MKDILINVSRETRMVDLTKSVIGNDSENLQSKLVFSFSDEFVNGQARIEYVINNEKHYQFLTKKADTYVIPVKNVLTKQGQIDMQLVITEGTSEEEIPIFKSNIFYLICNRSINAEIEQPDEYLQWVEIANTKLNEIDEAVNKANNLDIDVKKIDNVSTVTITKKDNTTKTVQILDGEIGPQGPQGVQGIQGEQGEQGIQGIQGIQGEKGFSPQANVEQLESGAKITVIDELGTTKAEIFNGADGYTPVKGKDYFTEEEQEEFKQDVETKIQPTLNNNLKTAKDYTDNSIAKDFKDISYDETTATFIFTRHDNTIFTVDLPIEQTVKDGRYDEETKELVLVLVSGQEIRIPASGLIDDYIGVDSATIQCAISADNKITCNIIAGTITKTLLTAELQAELDNKVNKTDYGTPSKAGIVKPMAGILPVDKIGGIAIQKATKEMIDGKTDSYRPIVPSNLDYAVGTVKASEVKSGTAKMWTSTNEDGEIGLNISTEV